MQELKSSKSRVVGLKQTIKVIDNKKATKVYVAQDADDYIKTSVYRACTQANLEIIYVKTMKELGEACGIDIGASTAALIDG